MLIVAPAVSFSSIQPEPGAAGYVYVFHTHADPTKIYVTQSIPRLAREVLYGLYGSSLNISSLYRSIDQPSKQRRARGYTLTSVDIDRLNELLNLYGGATFVVGCPELWCFDLASVGV
jgi:hypothetical protein